MLVTGSATFALVLLLAFLVDRVVHGGGANPGTSHASTVVMIDPKHDAQRTEDAGLTALHEAAPSTVNPSIQTPSIPSVPKPTPSKQEDLDLERSAGEGMTAPPSTEALPPS